MQMFSDTLVIIHRQNTTFCSLVGLLDRKRNDWICATTRPYLKGEYSIHLARRPCHNLRQSIFKVM